MNAQYKTLCVSLVDSSRKAVTHPVDAPSPQRPVARTEQAEDASMLPTGPRKTTMSQERSQATPHDPSEEGASDSQGKAMFHLKALYQTLEDTFFFWLDGEENYRWSKELDSNNVLI